MSRTMTEQERDRFLAEPHVAFLDDPESGPHSDAAPLFYDYEPGQPLSLFTWNRDRASRNRPVNASDSVISLTVWREDCPRVFVAVEGRVVHRSDRPSAQEVFAIARRYSNDDEARSFTEMVLESPDTDLVVFTLQPDRWLTGDAIEA